MFLVERHSVGRADRGPPAGHGAAQRLEEGLVVPGPALTLHVLRAVARQDLLVEDEADGAAVAAGVDAVDADVEVLAV